jgi:hypothetical protein
MQERIRPALLHRSRKYTSKRRDTAAKSAKNLIRDGSTFKCMSLSVHDLNCTDIAGVAM